MHRNGESDPGLHHESLLCSEELPGDRHPAQRYLARLAPGSQRAMRHALDTIATLLTEEQADVDSLDWSRLRAQHIERIRAELGERYAPAMQQKVLSALRGVLKEARALGQLSAEAYEQALVSTRVESPFIRATAPSERRLLTTSEIQALLAVCAADASPAGRRDAAMIATLYGAGLHRAQLVALNLEDYNRERRTLTVGGQIRPLPQGTAQALDDWLRVRGAASGALFVSFDQQGGLTGKLAGRRLTTQTVFTVLRTRSLAAAIGPVNPNDLRRAHQAVQAAIQRAVLEGLDVPYLPQNHSAL